MVTSCSVLCPGVCEEPAPSPLSSAQTEEEATYEEPPEQDTLYEGSPLVGSWWSVGQARVSCGTFWGARGACFFCLFLSCWACVHACVGCLCGVPVEAGRYT